MSTDYFKIEEIPVNKLQTKLLYISSAKYEGRWHSTIHSHHFTELFYVIKGEGRFLVDDNSFFVKKDDLVIVNPEVEHTEVSKDTSPLEYIVLGIEGLTFSSGIEELKNNYNLYNYKEYKDEVLFYLKALLKEVNTKEASYEIVCQNLLEVLIVNIIRRTNYALSVNPIKIMTKECTLVKNYIDTHFKEDITLDSLAKLTHMNKYYLVHTFKEHMDISPINYLIQRRIDESKILLATTDHSIGHISSILGFSSQSYFSQSFKRTTNQTPNQYRKTTIEKAKTL